MVHFKAQGPRRPCDEKVIKRARQDVLDPRFLVRIEGWKFLCGIMGRHGRRIRGIAVCVRPLPPLGIANHTLDFIEAAIGARRSALDDVAPNLPRTAAMAGAHALWGRESGEFSPYIFDGGLPGW